MIVKKGVFFHNVSENTQIGMLNAQLVLKYIAVELESRQAFGKWGSFCPPKSQSPALC